MDFKYEVVGKFGVLSENSKGWKKELTSVSWNNREPKYDIREWDPNYEKMGKGITLSVEEIKMLRDLLNDMVIE